MLKSVAVVDGYPLFKWAWKRPLLYGFTGSFMKRLSLLKSLKNDLPRFQLMTEDTILNLCLCICV